MSARVACSCCLPPKGCEVFERLCLVVQCYSLFLTLSPTLQNVQHPAAIESACAVMHACYTHLLSPAHSELACCINLLVYLSVMRTHCPARNGAAPSCVYHNQYAVFSNQTHMPCVHGAGHCQGGRCILSRRHCEQAGAAVPDLEPDAICSCGRQRLSCSLYARQQGDLRPLPWRNELPQVLPSHTPFSGIQQLSAWTQPASARSGEILHFTVMHRQDKGCLQNIKIVCPS